MLTYILGVKNHLNETVLLSANNIYKKIKSLLRPLIWRHDVIKQTLSTVVRVIMPNVSLSLSLSELGKGYICIADFKYMPREIP